MLSPQFVEEMKQKLTAQKEKLAEELKGLAPHTELGDSMDENAQEINTDEVDRDVIATIKSDLDKIDKALKKIEAGTYGTDDEGKEISEQRLKAMPWADKAI